MLDGDSKINYTLRPAKNIERKMICETLRNLYIFGDINEYQYVGFGSFFFADFRLFHKMLGINKMTSIEGSPSKEARCQFNKPYSYIDIKIGKSTDILSDLPLESKTVIWMDYIDQLNSDILADLNTMTSRLGPGSVMIITVNASPKDSLPGTKRRLEKEIGTVNIPIGLRDHDFAKWGTAKVFHRIIKNQIDDILKERNADGAAEYNLCYKQLFNFNYQDGAKMLTIGGVFMKDTQQELYRNSDFLKQKYIATSTVPYKIKAPILTSREIHHIDSKLPWNTIPAELNFLPESSLNAYQEVHRYFPFFAESEL